MLGGERRGAERVPRLIGVLMALPVEASAILACEGFGWEASVEGGFVSRRYPIWLLFSGVGKVLAAWACAALAQECDLILSLGASGGLGSEELGSLWLASEFVEHDMDLRGLGLPLGVTAFAGHDAPVYRTASDATLAVARGSLSAAGLAFGEARAASGDVFISDGERARGLAAATGARICDMESAAIAKLCALRARDAQGRALEFLALRAVSDNADHRAGPSWAEQAQLSSSDLSTFLEQFARRIQG